MFDNFLAAKRPSMRGTTAMNPGKINPSNLARETSLFQARLLSASKWVEDG